MGDEESAFPVAAVSPPPAFVSPERNAGLRGAFGCAKYRPQRKVRCSFDTALEYNAVNNHLTAIGSASAGYDAAGDLTYDGTSTYQYDAEGHLVGVTSGSFTWSGIYNALGWRVERTSSSAGRGEYVYGAAGTDLGNFNGGNGAWYEQYVPFDGRVLWYYNPSGNKSQYFHVNALGSLGLSTNQTGAPVEEMLYYPFGQGWQDSSGFWWDLKFAKMQTEDVDLHMEMTPHRMYYPLVGPLAHAGPNGRTRDEPAIA